MTDTDTEIEGAGDTETTDPASSTSKDLAPDAPAETISFWDRPLVERYFTPFILPVLVVVGLVVYVLNVSRLFLSAHGHVPIIIGTVITIVILVGATVLSAGAELLRKRQIILVTATFLFAISFSGWISLGHSQEKNAGATTLGPTVKAKQTENVTAAPGGNLTFQPKTINATTGLVKFEVLIGAAGHTFGFHDPATLFAELKLEAGGTTVPGVAFFGAAGDYTYFCSVPGHESAGMQGTVHVTGPTVTLDQALTQAGNPPGAAGGK